MEAHHQSETDQVFIEVLFEFLGQRHQPLCLAASGFVESVFRVRTGVEIIVI